MCGRRSRGGPVVPPEQAPSTCRITPLNGPAAWRLTMTTISRNGDDAALGGPARLESRIERVDKSSPADIRSLRWTATLRTVSLVIPAKNEAASIRWVLEQVPDCVDEIILVDGHSTDATIAMANSCWPDLEVLRQQGKGKGDAL